MRKKIISIICIICFFPSFVRAAASYSLSAPTSVENGGSVTATLTLKGTAAWDVKIISAGSTSGCTQSFVDVTSNGKDTTKTLSVTCKATSLGIISFTAQGKITNANYEVTNVSVTKRVNVVPPREKSNDATLSSITVEGFELNPAFSKNTLEYRVDAPSTIDKIKIDAKVNESHASLTGTGEYEVTEGINTFKLVVTSETGRQLTYTINVNVEDQNPIEIKIGNENYTIIKNVKSLTQPNLFEETTIKINDFDIPAFYNDVANMTLVGVKDESGNVLLAIYNNNTYEIYNEYKNANLNLYLKEFDREIEGYIKTTITINDQLVPAYKKTEDSRFAIVYGLNLETGESNLYSYDTKEKSFQIWNEEEIELLQKENKTYLYTCIAFGGGLVFSFIAIISILTSRRKKNKNKNPKKKQEEVNEKKEIEKKEEVKKDNQ